MAGLGVNQELKLSTTAAAVSGAPFENFTPLRSWNVYVSPPRETFQEVASIGSTVPFGPEATSSSRYCCERYPIWTHSP